MRSVELTFGESLDSLVRSDWSRFADAGLPSLAAHTAPSNRPHITLAAGHELALHAGSGDLWDGLPLGIHFSGLVVFPTPMGRFVLARLVVPSRTLLKLHTGLHRRCTGAFAYTCPDAWTPHVTLSRRIPGELLGAAMELVDARAEGWCTDARLWDGPTKTVTSLSGAPHPA
jgi:hypothetical protein